jgi:hypothetical protein
MNNLKIKELRKLSHKLWSMSKVYTKLLIINSGLKHDSGFALIYVIGVTGHSYDNMEIAAACDDISWCTPLFKEYSFRTDMLYPSGIIQMWATDYSFKVGASLNSININLIKNE